MNISQQGKLQNAAGTHATPVVGTRPDRTLPPYSFLRTFSRTLMHLLFLVMKLRVHISEMFVGDVCVHLSGRDVSMPQKCLHTANISTIL